MTRGFGVFLAILLPAFASGLSATAAEPATAPAVAATAAGTQPSDDLAHWREVVARLGDESFTKRKAAQKELDTLTYRQLDMLRQLAATATDDEVKSRLQTRISEIEEELAVSPPPISLDVQAATLNEVAAALGKSLGTPLEVWPPGGSGGQRGMTWTLSVKEKPFWEVIGELEKQHGFGFQDFNGSMRLVRQNDELRSGVISGGLAVFPQSITRSTTVNFQQETGGQVQPEQLSLNFMAILDPRVSVSHGRPPELTRVADDLGNVLYQQSENQSVWNCFGQSSHMWNQSISLTIPAKLGRNIASAQGQLRFIVQLASERMEVTDLDKKLNQPLKIGVQTVTLKQFEPQPGNHEVRFQIQGPPFMVPNTPGAEVDPARSPIRVAFIDSNNKQIWSMELHGGTGGSFEGDFVPPLKMVLSVPTKLKKVTIPFELKNLPLP